jgi:hypothetical protein
VLEGPCARVVTRVLGVAQRSTTRITLAGRETSFGLNASNGPNFPELLARRRAMDDLVPRQGTFASLGDPD